MGTRRRWLQFSLRGLLIVLTIGCMWLGWEVERARRQHRAIDAIENVGGVVLYGPRRNPDAWETQSDLFRLIPLAEHSPERSWLEMQLNGFEFRKVTGVVFRLRKSHWSRHGPGGGGGVEIESMNQYLDDDILATVPLLSDLCDLRTIYLEGGTTFTEGVQISDAVERRLRTMFPRCQIIRDKMQIATNAPAAD